MATRQLLASVGLGLAMAAFALLFTFAPLANRLENQYALGLLYRLRGQLTPPQGAVVIAIDKETIAWLRDLASEPGSKPLLIVLAG